MERTTPRLGRPPSDDPRTRRHAPRATADEWALLERAAHLSGQPITGLLLTPALREAQRLIKRHKGDE